MVIFRPQTIAELTRAAAFSRASVGETPFWVKNSSYSAAVGPDLGRLTASANRKRVGFNAYAARERAAS
jgi:hypothetical protein